MINFGWLILSLLVGYSIGWRNAHMTIALECERLGSFFVGKRTFKCSKIEEVDRG